MKQEEKQLLLKDLCARLPYGIKVKIVGTNNPPEKVLKVGLDLPNPYITTETWAMCYPLDVRPYLRPMSSMTKEEYEEYSNLEEYNYIQTVDFLLSNHFDFRGLIERKLAIALFKTYFGENCDGPINVRAIGSDGCIKDYDVIIKED